MTADISTLAALRRTLSRFAPDRNEALGSVGFGLPALDETLGGGLARAGLHEFHAGMAADVASVTGLAAGLCRRAAEGRPVAWVRQDWLDIETGRLHPPGLAEWGLDPACVLLVRGRDADAVLRAGAEAARCPALGALVIAFWGAPRLFDLTASRRLALAAEASGVTIFLLRVAAEPAASAAATRWSVQAAPSRPLEANAPGPPALLLRLLRHRAGLPEREWRLEWNRDRACFQDRIFEDRIRPRVTPLSRPLVSVPADRPAATGRVA